MKALVVGGAGFIGSNLCEALLEQKNQVVCIDNLSLGKKENIKELLENEKFIFYEGDATNEDILLEIFSKEMPEAVFHLAANSDIQTSAKNPQVEYRNTYTTTFIILECMRKCGIKQLFFASTSAVYGDKRDIELTEDASNFEPISYYGATKLLSLIHI